MSALHTAGPWEYDGNCAGYVRATALDDQPAIARAYSRDDARLIAAAPDLLEAAQKACGILEEYIGFLHRMPVNDLEMHPYIPTVEDAYDTARAAISRATGEQP